VSHKFSISQEKELCYSQADQWFQHCQWGSNSGISRSSDFSMI